MQNQNSSSRDERLAFLTLFTSSAAAGTRIEALEAVQVHGIRASVDRAVAELARLPKPLRCSGELRGRILEVKARQISPQLDGKIPYAMAAVVPEERRQYFERYGQGPLSERAVLLRSREDKLLTTAQDFVDWRRDYWPDVSMLFTAVAGSSDRGVTVEVYLPVAGELPRQHTPES